MRAVRVVEREGERVAERVVDVRLGREVHDGVDLLVLEDEVEEVGRLDVALDELSWRRWKRREKGGGEKEERGVEFFVLGFFQGRVELSSDDERALLSRERGGERAKKKTKKNKTRKMRPLFQSFRGSFSSAFLARPRETPSSRTGTTKKSESAGASADLGTLSAIALKKKTASSLSSARRFFFLLTRSLSLFPSLSLSLQTLTLKLGLSLISSRLCRDAQ